MPSTILHPTPTLYKTTSTGKEQMWDIKVLMLEENKPYPTIRITYGQVGGKLQVKDEVIKVGKNLGKSNETTPAEQALSEAEARWTKQKERKGYSEERGGQDLSLRPMLAHKYLENQDKVTFPCFVQPKLDGCVSGEALVKTKEFGYKTIKWLVDNKPKAKVLSYNNQTKKTEYKDILSYFENIVVTEQTEWFEIVLDSGEKLTITGNHMVYMPKLDCWRRVDELEIGQSLMVL